VSARGTRATELLNRRDVPHTVHEYETDGAAAGSHRYGEEAARALGVDPMLIFKTLVVELDGSLAIAIVPVAAELDLKRFASVLGGRRAALAERAVAERATGYVIGGISPLGQRRTLATVLDASAAAHATMYVSAGRRGLQVELAPGDLVALTGAVQAHIARST
jgi:Cys-tRNA(Pro)/Cys-tRNA(Cys) deacylase